MAKLTDSVLHPKAGHATHSPCQIRQTIYRCSIDDPLEAAAQVARLLIGLIHILILRIRPPVSTNLCHDIRSRTRKSGRDSLQNNRVPHDRDTPGSMTMVRPDDRVAHLRNNRISPSWHRQGATPMQAGSPHDSPTRVPLLYHWYLFDEVAVSAKMDRRLELKSRGPICRVSSVSATQRKILLCGQSFGGKVYYRKPMYFGARISQRKASELM